MRSALRVLELYDVNVVRPAFHDPNLKMALIDGLDGVLTRLWKPAGRFSQQLFDDVLSQYAETIPESVPVETREVIYHGLRGVMQQAMGRLFNEFGAIDFGSIKWITERNSVGTRPIKILEIAMKRKSIATYYDLAQYAQSLGNGNPLREEIEWVNGIRVLPFWEVGQVASRMLYLHLDDVGLQLFPDGYNQHELRRGGIKIC